MNNDKINKSWKVSNYLVKTVLYSAPFINFIVSYNELVNNSSTANFLIYAVLGGFSAVLAFRAHESKEIVGMWKVIMVMNYGVFVLACVGFIVGFALVF